MVNFTSRFRFGVPEFLDEPWHEHFEALIHQIDNALYQIAIAESVSFWDNDVVYAVSDLVIDELAGILYTCATAHTSPASPTTFAQDRVANPARWNATANIPQQRGNWVTATTYNVGDFVVESQRYAVCIVGHVSGVFNTDLAAAKWVVLIDLSTLGVGINTEAEATVASGATVDLGAISSSRIFIIGTTNITSFGIVANQIKILRYEDILNVVHHATDLILPAGANRVTDAGGYQIVTSNSAGKWREVNWHPGSGPSAVPVASTTQQGVVELATTAETQALADTTRAVTPAGLAGALSDLSASVLSIIRDGVSSTLDTLAEIATAIGLLAPKANPTFTGVVTVPTPALNDNTTKAASTAYVVAEILDRVPTTVKQIVLKQSAPNSDFAINSVANVSLGTANLTGLVAGDEVEIEALFTIANASGGLRNYTFTIEFGSLQITTLTCTVNTTGRTPFYLKARCSISAVNLAYCIAFLLTGTGAAANTDQDVDGNDSPMNWNTTAGDLTGAMAIALKVLSNAATATQTLMLHSFAVRKLKAV